eukprot:8999625-Lingulodinium_polyedra.AAC.1
MIQAIFMHARVLHRNTKWVKPFACKSICAKACAGVLQGYLCTTMRLCARQREFQCSCGGRIQGSAWRCPQLPVALGNG